MNQAQVCRSKVASGRKVGGLIRSLIKVRGLQIEGVRVLYEALIVPVV